MARRIRDIPDDAEWPELEDEYIPDKDPLPDAGGPYTRALEYLHGARATLNANLVTPTRLLAATTARFILLLAEENNLEIPREQRDTFERIAEGNIPEDTDGAVEDLARLAAFVEQEVQSARRKETDDSRGGEGRA